MNGTRKHPSKKKQIYQVNLYNKVNRIHFLFLFPHTIFSLEFRRVGFFPNLWKELVDMAAAESERSTAVYDKKFFKWQDNRVPGADDDDLPNPN